MTTLESPTIYVLEGLIRCRNCDAELQVRPLGDAGVFTYRCPVCAETRPSRSMPAEELERWILRQVTDTVLTDSNTRMLTQEMAAAGAALSDSAPEALCYPERHPDRIRAMATDPETFLIPDNVPDARRLMSKLISHITLGDQEAVVHYAVPLPQDSALAGAYRQHLPLPHDGVE